MVDGLVRLEYSGRVNGKVFDTTIAEEAKKEGVFREKAAYGPVLVMVGKGQVIPGLDEALSEAREGEQKTVTLPPEKAFGQRNPELVKLVSSEVFKQQGITPYTGLVVELDNRRARVQSVSGGRVRVDFNHDLAGQAVDYAFKIIKTFNTPSEKVLAYCEQELPEAKASYADGVCSVKLSLKAADSANVVLKKFRLIENTLAAVPELKSVKFEEEYSR